MQQKALRIGVVGLGRIGWDFHCATLSKNPAFILAGVADTVPERCREAEATYDCRAFADYRRLLDEVDLDVLTIASPTHLHRAMAEAALERGLHVLLEKPMALNVRQAQAIVKTARRCNKLVTVYQPHRTAAYFQQLRRVINSGIIGEIYHVRRGVFSFSQRNDWQSLRRFGGGMLANFGAHAMDQVLQLIGYDVDRLFCRIGRVASVGDAEDVVKIVIQTRKGLLGEVDISQACVQQLYELEVIGTTGVISLHGQELHVRSFNVSQLPAQQLNRSLASARREYPAGGVACKDQIIPIEKRYAIDVYKDFAEAIRKHKQPLVKAEEAVALTGLLDRCRTYSRRIIATPIRPIKRKKRSSP
ncbi:MAG: Gfo/Idh/MocA family oxidoreductase [bacterium]